MLLMTSSSEVGARMRRKRFRFDYNGGTKNDSVNVCSGLVVDIMFHVVSHREF